MTRAQALKFVEVIGVTLTDDSDEDESLELDHLELRQRDLKEGEDAPSWVLQTDWTDREEDESVHRTFITIVDQNGEVTDVYESN